MTVVNTLKSSSATITLDQLQQLAASGSLDTSNITDVSVFNASTDSSDCKDGSDDGKIGFFEGVGEFFKGIGKGVVNGVKGMFFDDEGNFSLWQTLKTVATGAACFIPGVGPVIAGGLCAYGAVKGTAGVVSGVVSACNATTDGEKRAALQSIGGNTLSAGLSIVGLKGSVGAIAKNAGIDAVVGKTGTSITGTLRKMATTGEGGVIKNLASNITAGARNYYGSVWSEAAGGVKNSSMSIGQKASTAVKVGKQTLLDTGANIYDACANIKNGIKEKFSKKQSGNTTKATTEKTTSKAVKDPATKTKTYTKKIESLSDDVQASIKSGNGTGQIDSTHSYETIGNGKVKITETYNPSTTGLKGTINKGLDTVKSYADARAAFSDGSVAYQGSTTAGAISTVASKATSNAASDLEQNVQTAATTFATVDMQTGRYFELEDYNTLSSKDIDTKYANIMAQTAAL